KATGAAATGVALASGWPENGSTCGDTRSPTRADDALVSLQWIGAKIEPRCWEAEVTTLSVQAPCRERTRAKPLLESPCALASSGWISRNGSGLCAPSFGLWPLRVMLCHWSRSRPVLSRSGYSALVSSRNVG